MTKIISMLLVICLLATLSACAETDQSEQTEPTVITDPTEPTEELVVPEVDLLINLDSNDTQTHMRVFPSNRTSSQEYARVHIYVHSEKEVETIRLKLERKYGTAERVEGDFVTGADLFYEIPANEWYDLRFKISPANVYFYRITLYYGEHEILLDSKTIYTPYMTAVYSESDFDDTPPEFRPMNGLIGEEQELYDACQYAINDYAALDYYLKVKSISAWKTEQYLYLKVEYEVTDGTETVWFAIRSDDYQNYTASTSANGIVPNEVMTKENNALADYFYVNRALTDKISE